MVILTAQGARLLTQSQLIMERRLMERKQQCLEPLKPVSNRLNDDVNVQTAFRRLLGSKDMLSDFGRIESESRNLASLVLQAAVAVLVKTETVRSYLCRVQTSY
jgi:hypothetical protein